MKNLLKVCLLGFMVMSMASCIGSNKSGTTDSVGSRTDTSNTSSTVDTSAKADTAKADTTKR